MSVTVDLRLGHAVRRLRTVTRIIFIIRTSRRITNLRQRFFVRLPSPILTSTGTRISINRFSATNINKQRCFRSRFTNSQLLNIIRRVTPFTLANSRQRRHHNHSFRRHQPTDTTRSFFHQAIPASVLGTVRIKLTLRVPITNNFTDLIRLVRRRNTVLVQPTSRPGQLTITTFQMTRFASMHNTLRLPPRFRNGLTIRHTTRRRQHHHLKAFRVITLDPLAISRITLNSINMAPQRR